jgi:arsenate reductase (glutaredoxin)
MKNLPIMKKIYYLKTCDTCKKILKSLPNISEFVLVDIKENPLTVYQLEELYNLTQSYEVLFSRKAKLYKEMGLKDFDLTEADYKRYILEHYTFLSRPVIVDEQNIFVGSSPKTLQAIAQHFAK